MANGAEYDLGVAEVLEAEAIGPPGQRRFRLRITAGDTTASIWCEKTQVSALSEAIQQVLARHRRTADGRRPASRPLEPFPDRATHDFLAGQIALGYDEDADAITLFATDVETGGANPLPTLRVDLNRQVARLFHRAGRGDGRRRTPELSALQAAAGRRRASLPAYQRAFGRRTRRNRAARVLGPEAPVVRL